MPVIRVEKNKDFTVMSNYHLRDRRLSMKARGLLSTMLSLPPDWDYTVAGLATLSPDGVASVRASLAELETAGYMQRRQTHDGGGKFAGTDYVIYECPAETDETPETGNLPLCENRTTVPLCEKPITEKPISENRTQVNIQEINTNTPISPQGGKRRGKSKPEWKPDRFERFWTYYPREGQKAKVKAMAAWDRLKPDDDLLVTMAKALKAQKESELWQRGVAIPYVSTWLNQQRWTDPADVPGGYDTGGGWTEPREVIA